MDCVEVRLYWTDDDGSIWRDITPPNGARLNFSQVYFLDSTHGWVITEESQPDGEWTAALLSTHDGGKSWQVFSLPTSLYQPKNSSGPVTSFFSDPQHGWILRSWATRFDENGNALFATTDGGNTWKRLPNPPGAGPMSFASATEGWMIGDPENQEGGSTSTHANQLWATHDGGLHWQPIRVPVPTNSEEEGITFSAVRLKNPQKGMLAALVEDTQGGTSSRLVGGITNDGGKTWQFSEFEGRDASLSLIDTHFVWVRSGRGERGVTIRNGVTEISTTIPGFSLRVGTVGGYFIDDLNGWFVYRTPPRFGGPPRPAIPGIPDEALFSTADGGKTFHVITPPGGSANPALPPLQIITVNGIYVLGFTSPFSRMHSTPPGISSGELVEIRGTRFLPENTVWIGSRKLEVASKDGDSLLFLAPPDLPAGTYDLHVENAVGRTNTIQAIACRAGQKLKITSIDAHDANSSEALIIHPGQPMRVFGSGFLFDNTVWFGTQAAAASLQFSGAASLIIDVPASLAPGPCEIYVTNGAGKSNVVSAMVR